MMEAIGSNLSSARVNASTDLPTAENRASTQPVPAEPQRQAGAIPGVSVQISSAARELVARDPLSASPQSTTETRTNTALATGTAAPSPDAANTPEDPAGSNGINPQSAQARQAIQLFAETAGIGVNQQNESPLRTSA